MSERFASLSIVVSFADPNASRSDSVDRKFPRLNPLPDRGGTNVQQVSSFGNGVVWPLGLVGHRTPGIFLNSSHKLKFIAVLINQRRREDPLE